VTRLEDEHERAFVQHIRAVLEEAFGYFGGVPQELLLDQMKAVITRELRLEGGTLIRNAEFLALRASLELYATRCRPYRAQTKEKVERPRRRDTGAAPTRSSRYSGEALGGTSRQVTA
jgi:transposase